MFGEPEVGRDIVVADDLQDVAAETGGPGNRHQVQRKHCSFSFDPGRQTLGCKCRRLQGHSQIHQQ